MESSQSKNKKKNKNKISGQNKLDNNMENGPHGSLSECVTHAVELYFSHLDQASTRDVYQLVMQEVEVPLLKVVMNQTNHNQSLAAEVLGLNRGTLRKKLKEYGML